MLPDRISERPADSLRTGAASFKRWLGSRSTQLSAHPAAPASPRKPNSQHRKHDRADVGAVPTRPRVREAARDDQQPHRIEDEEGAQDEQYNSKAADHDGSGWGYLTKCA